MALVTVAIPTFNRADLLRRAVASVLDQTLQDFELYVSDNGSTDGTAEVMASFTDARVHFAPLPANRGREANFTRCLHLGSAPLVTLLQDDDLMLRDNLARKVELLLDHPELVIAHAGFRYIDADDQILREFSNWMGSEVDLIEPGRTYIEKSFAGGSRINFSSAVMRRSALEGARFEVEDGPACDMGLWMRLARKGDIGYIAEPLTAIRRHADADTVHVGTARLVSGGYRPNFNMVRCANVTKGRFLLAYGHEIDSPRRYRRVARAWARRTLLDVARSEALEAPSLVRTARLLAGAARVEPTVLLDGLSARLIARTVLATRAGSHESGTPAA